MGNFVIPKTTSSPTVPAGGTFGQILAKTNEFDFNTQWINNTDLNAAIGTGTINYLSKFTGSNTLGNSLLFDNGTKVGIGTTSFVGSIKLAVNGQIGGPTYSATYLDITGAIPELRGNSGIGYYSSIGNHIFYGGSSVEYMRLTTAGLLGIGTNSPSEILHISGTTSADRSIRLDRDISSANGQFYLKGTTISGSPALLIGSGNSISGNFTGISYMGGSNNVGIGMSTTIAPTSPLTVGRNITQTVAGGYTYISATSALTFTQNTLSNSNVVGFLGVEFYYAGNSTYGNARLLNMTAYVSNTSASNTMRAGYISARTSSGGSATTLTGYTGELVLSGTGAVINAIGQEISLIQDGIKTTTNLYGIKVQDLTNSAGTVTNTYGIYLGNLTAGTQTNAAYGIYQSSATNKNYFAGNVGIGTTSPASKLDVFGIASSAGGVNSNIGYNITPVVAPIAGMTATPVAGSGLNIGQYYYAITYYNSLGETSAYYGISAVTTAGNQQVNLASIPISTNTTVIGRKIYRGKVGEGTVYGGLIATIANNTATTYSDTIPDSSVPGGIILDRAIYGKPNLSANYISVNSVRSLVVDTNLTAVGYGAGTSVTNAPQSTFVGAGAGVNVTSGAGNTLVGKNAGSSITTGSQNSILGDTSGNGITTGSYNIGLGPNVLNSGVAGSFNIAMGYYTMNKGTGSYNILLGGYNWSSGTPTASYCTFIGGSLTNISSATNYQVNINDLITGISSGTKYVNILGSLGIGLAYGTAPVASAQVQIDSTAKGFLPPRMTTLQKIGITLPAIGLVIYDTDLNKLCVFTNVWETVTSI